MRYVQSGFGKRKYQPKKNGWFSDLKQKSKTKKKIYRSNDEIAWRSSPFKREKAPIRKLQLTIFSLPALIIAWAAVMLYTPYFKVTEVSYSGLRVTKLGEMQELVENTLLKGSTYLPKNNFFLINEGSVANELKKSFALNSAVVTKIFPNTLEVVIEEKISSIIYDNGKKYFLLDQSGNVQRYLKDADPSENSIETLAVSVPTQNNSTTSAMLAMLLTNEQPNTSTTEQKFIHSPNYATIRREYGGYPLVYDTTQPDVQTDQSGVMSAKKMKGIIEMYNLVEKNGLARIRYMEMGDAGSGVGVLSNQPWKIYFEANENIEVQYNHLKAILKDNKPQEYIDVRYGDRVFWK